MENTRTNRIERLLQKDLGSIFTIEAKSILRKAMVTVTKVKITRDFSIARIYLSVFGTDNKKSIVDEICLQKKNIRNILAHKIKNQVRKIPELEFYQDDSLDYIDNIDNLLKK